MTQKVKKCQACKETLLQEAFGIDTQKKSGLTSYCKHCRRKSRIAQYKKHKERELRETTKYYYKNKEKLKLHHQNKMRSILGEIYDILGKKCQLCGISDMKVLQIDHIHGGGNYQRKILTGDKGYQFILKEVKSGSDNYRILCANCNLLEAIKLGLRQTLWH